jgi:hypothetical protein
MKTKTLSVAMAALAFAAATPFAFARPDFPVNRLTSGPRTTTVERMPEHCSMSCCVTKWKSNPALGGRGASSSFKKVKACTDSCGVSTKERRTVCRMGSRG